MISSGSGLLSGGAQRTAAAMYASVSRRPSSGACGRGEVGEAGSMERGHEEVAGPARAVAGEHAARAVGAVRGGCEAKQQEPRGRIAEAGHRTAPVDLVAVRALLLDGDAPAVACAGANIARMTRLHDEHQPVAEQALSGHDARFAVEMGSILREPETRIRGCYFKIL